MYILSIQTYVLYLDDANRIVLPNIIGQSDADYINASYINLSVNIRCVCFVSLCVYFQQAVLINQYHPRDV